MAKGLRKPLALYLALQSCNKGKLHTSDAAWSQIRATLNMRDNRTFNKHLGQLLALKWVVVNPKSGYYFVKSFDRVRIALGVKDTSSCQLFLSDLSRVQSWCDAIVINGVIRNQRYYWQDGPKRFKQIRAYEKEGANTVYRVDPKTTPAYFGLSNHRIADLLNCALSQACKRKRAAEAAGFLTLKKRFKVVCTLKEADHHIRSQVNAWDRELARRLRFRTVTINGVKAIQLVQQLHDQIIPNVVFSKRKKISSLLRSPVGSAT